MKINIIKYYFYAKARCNMSITPTLHRTYFVHAVLQEAPLRLDSDLPNCRRRFMSDTAFCGIPICRPLLSDLHTEIAAVISAPQRHASLPDQLRMQPGIADVITVAKAAAQLLAAIFCAGVVIGALHHIHTPDAVTGLQFFFGAKPAAGPKTLWWT